MHAQRAARSITVTRLAGWLRPNLLWALVGFVVGYVVGFWLGDNIAGNYAVAQNSGTNNVAIVLALSFGVLGWLVGIGVFNYPVLKLFGLEPAPAVPDASFARYFRLTEDHKVVGMQYTIGSLLFLFTGGMFAMMIRDRAARPHDSRLRTGDLHRGRRGTRDDHDDDGDARSSWVPSGTGSCPS